MIAVDITNSEIDSLAEAQPHTVDGEKENSIINDCGSREELSYLLRAEDVRNPGYFWSLYKRDVLPCFVQNMGVEKLESVEVKFHGVPGVRLQKRMKIIQQLILGQIVQLAIKVIADPSKPSGICFNGFGLIASKFQMLAMLDVLLVKVLVLW